MSFATSQKLQLKQQQQQQKQQFQFPQSTKKQQTTTTNCSTKTSFPTTYITAQNCFSNFHQTQQTTQKENTKIKKSSFESTTTITSATAREEGSKALMIKNIESTATTTSSTLQQENDEKKEEENELSLTTERKDSATFEFIAAQDSSSFNISNYDQPTLVIYNHRKESLSLPEQVAQLTQPTATNATNEELKSNDTTEIISNALNLPETTSISTTSTTLITKNGNTSEVESAATQIKPTTTTTRSHRTPSPVSDSSKRRKDSTDSKVKTTGSRNSLNASSTSSRYEEADTVSKSSDTSGELVKFQPSSTSTQDTQNSTPPSSSGGGGIGLTVDKIGKNVTRLSERAKKKSWYNVLYPTYKSRADDFKKLFKDVPNDERLIVDYSCALQRDILVQGRLYVSQNYVCFHANIFRWETYLSIKWKDVTSITKEKTALVIPNAISICTAKEKYFFATFATRDKAFLMLFRVWQNTLMNKQMLPQEMWQHVHNCYGDELGLTTDDEDYIDPTTTTTSCNNETEGELDFSSALEDTVSINSNLQQFTTAPLNIESNSVNFATSGSGSNSSCGIGGGGSSIPLSLPPPASRPGPTAISKKSKKSYFFSSNKSSSNSANATSGSDNKASDNNCGGGDYKKSNMNSYAKQLTLISAEPDDNNTGAAELAEGNNIVNASATAHNVKEPKSTTTAILAVAPTHDGKRKVSKNSRQRDETLSKNIEAIPTDISDSSDSEENKIPFVLTAECTSPHEGRQLVHTILPIKIETLFNLLFSKSKFLVDFHAMRKSTDINFPDWVTDEHGHKTRTVNVTVQLGASVGPKCSKVTEHQVMRDCSKPGELYSIDINSVNAGIPYADSFSVLMHYCLVRTVDDHTMLSVHARINYKKSIWGMVKGFIEKNTWAGLEDFYGALLSSLQSESIPPAKGKGRRPRRATAAQVRPTDESAITAVTQVKSEPAENLLATNSLQLLNVNASTSQSLSGETSASKYKWLSLFVIVLLLFLIVVNVILLHKLWKLEERIEEDISSRARMPNLSSLKQLPSSHQEWMELLRQQEILHETELRKWHQVLQAAIELLKKTEKTLAELMFR